MSLVLLGVAFLWVVQAVAGAFSMARRGLRALPWPARVVASGPDVGRLAAPGTEAPTPWVETEITTPTDPYVHGARCLRDVQSG